MQEQQKQPAARRRRRVLWAAIALAALLGGSVAGYAASGGLRAWIWSVHVDEEGIVTNADGEVIGFTVENEHGSETTFIQMGEGHIQVTPVDPDESLRGKGFGIPVEE